VDSVLTTGEVLDLIQVANLVLFLPVWWIWKTRDTHYDLCVFAVQIYRVQDTRGIFLG
jgi:hypothetical protein